MGYVVKNNMEESRGLGVLISALRGLDVDIKTHDGEVAFGQIGLVSPPGDGQYFQLEPIDSDGRRKDTGPITQWEVDQIAEVNIW